MKKVELIYKEILDEAIERKNRAMTQIGIAKKLKVSISTVHHALKPLKKMNAVNVKQRMFQVTEPKKILYYWASIRNPEKDVVYKTRAKGTVKEIEKNMPPSIVYAAYTAYKIRFKDAPSDYSEVYVYGDENTRERYPEEKGPANLIVLKKDESMGKITSIAHTFADLWNIKSWYAKEYVKALEEKIDGLLE